MKKKGGTEKFNFAGRGPIGRILGTGLLAPATKGEEGLFFEKEPALRTSSFLEGEMGRRCRNKSANKENIDLKYES